MTNNLMQEKHKNLNWQVLVSQEVIWHSNSVLE